ncbi:hypothetical protein B0I35DRAFT_441996 [Stachybotrys elegans]|uniref:Secreted protein n=1 Tax=Stachybotrys elegans TaxID=80388 RepID=A0A8K0SHN8_9HYPO|nr:hypothetical protein B0I35DRAFT_441996 [Stachybotrys elegans]
MSTPTRFSRPLLAFSLLLFHRCPCFLSLSLSLSLSLPSARYSVLSSACVSVVCFILHAPQFPSSCAAGRQLCDDRPR